MTSSFSNSVQIPQEILSMCNSPEVAGLKSLTNVRNISPPQLSLTASCCTSATPTRRKGT